MTPITILKSSEKYLIYAGDDPARGRCVYKIAQQGNERLNKEVERLRLLRDRARQLVPHLLPVYDHGVFARGPHRGKAYYVQQHVDAATFSQHVQHALADGDALERTFRSVFQKLFAIALEDIGAQSAERPVQILRAALLLEYERLARRPHIAALLHADGIIINGVRHPPLAASLDRILAAPAFVALDARPPFLATLGHWNFHGDNILLTDPNDGAHFFIIDPDVTWDVADPFFSIARFCYTFPHDTADYGQYALQTELFTTQDDRQPEFRLTLQWPETVAKNYRRLFGAFEDPTASAFAELVPDAHHRLRLQLALLLCLLRGVNANYEEDIRFIDGRITAFRNKGIFLFLRSIAFADRLAQSLV